MNKSVLNYPKSLLLSCFLFLLIATAHGQSVTNSTISSLGVSVTSGTGPSLSYTVGQPAVTSLVNKNVQLTQGLHQPNYLVTTGIFTERYTGAIKLKAYPNPFVNELVLHFDELDNKDDIMYQIIDVSGKIFMQNNLHSGEESLVINTEELPVGIYLLRVTNNAELVKTIQLHKLK